MRNTGFSNTKKYISSKPLLTTQNFAEAFKRFNHWLHFPDTDFLSTMCTNQCDKHDNPEFKSRVNNHPRIK